MRTKNRHVINHCLFRKYGCSIYCKEALSWLSLYFLLSIYDHKKSTTFLFFVYGNECDVNFFNFNSLMHLFTRSKIFWFGIKFTTVNGWIPSWKNEWHKIYNTKKSNSGISTLLDSGCVPSRHIINTIQMMLYWSTSRWQRRPPTPRTLPNPPLQQNS